MFTLLTLGLAFCFSTILPFAILSLRNTVLSNRRSIIHDLEKLFELKDSKSNEDQIVPSFEFVKYKYFMRGNKEDPSENSRSKGASSLAFFVCSLPLIILVFAFGSFAFSVVLSQVLTPRPDGWGVMPAFLHLVEPPLPADRQSILWVFVVAFLGGYLFAVRGLLRAVNNFDLNPGSFISAALHLLLGVVTAVVIVVGGVSTAITGLPGFAVPASIIAAFIIGFIPEFGLRALYRTSQLWLFKREDTELFKSFQATPVEVVDGIDTEIRSRLAEFNIFTVQNLATANPIMLFVETPYGIYQSIDWVAQAQLCAAVGPRAVLRLWKLGIRTIFDFEKAVLGKGYTTEQLRQAVGLALLADIDEATMQRLKSSESAMVDDATIIALVENKVDDLHVHRLRQIANRIEHRLGTENKRCMLWITGLGASELANDRSHRDSRIPTTVEE